MKIGILGAGNVGGALAQGWLRAGHEVYFGVRNPQADDVQAIVKGSQGRAQAGGVNDAVQFGEVVVLALPWPSVKSIVNGLDLKGKVVLDCTNPILPQLAGIEVGTTTSGGEQIAELIPGAHVVKIFNTTGSGNMENPIYDGKAIPMFYCGNDAGAKVTAAGLAADLGFWPVDAGPLTNSRLLEPMAMLWVWLAYQGGMGREFAFQIVKR